MAIPSVVSVRPLLRNVVCQPHAPLCAHQSQHPAHASLQSVVPNGTPSRNRTGRLSAKGAMHSSQPDPAPWTLIRRATSARHHNRRAPKSAVAAGRPRRQQAHAGLCYPRLARASAAAPGCCWLLSTPLLPAAWSLLPCSPVRSSLVVVVQRMMDSTIQETLNQHRGRHAQQPSHQRWLALARPLWDYGGASSTNPPPHMGGRLVEPSRARSVLSTFWPLPSRATHVDAQTRPIPIDYRLIDSRCSVRVYSKHKLRPLQIQCSPSQSQKLVLARLSEECASEPVSPVWTSRGLPHTSLLDFDRFRFVQALMKSKQQPQPQSANDAVAPARGPQARPRLPAPPAQPRELGPF